MLAMQFSANLPQRSSAPRRRRDDPDTMCIDVIMSKGVFVDVESQSRDPNRSAAC
jgi:hypothetical protein